MKKIAISLGDLNGIGLEIALRAHGKIVKFSQPVYCINEKMLLQGAKMLRLNIPHDFTIAHCKNSFQITPGVCTKDAGQASFESFKKALNLAKMGYVDAIVTLPINKFSWDMANIPYKGHTDALADMLKENAIMMLGCEELFVALFTHHVPLCEVSKQIKTNDLISFLLDFYKCVKADKIGVLALNPHAGDGGVLGDEEKCITEAINEANRIFKSKIFIGPLVPDVAFSKQNRAIFKHFVCMYHDQGLIPLKAMYFDESINISLNLSILRTSVDHGTAYDKAYKNETLNLKSYINAVKYATKD